MKLRVFDWKMNSRFWVAILLICRKTDICDMFFLVIIYYLYKTFKRVKIEVVSTYNNVQYHWCLINGLLRQNNCPSALDGFEFQCGVMIHELDLVPLESYLLLFKLRLSFYWASDCSFPLYKTDVAPFGIEVVFLSYFYSCYSE